MALKAGLGIDDLLKPKRDEILALAAKHGAYNVRVFGSVARGEATESSDVDFLIDYNLEQISGWFPVGLIHDLEDLLHRKVDIALPDSIHPFIRDRIFQEAIQL